MKGSTFVYGRQTWDTIITSDIKNVFIEKEIIKKEYITIDL